MAKTSLKWSMIEGERSILETFEMLAELGFDGVELDAPNDFAPAEILAASKATGVAVPGVINARHWATPLTHPDAEVRNACITASIEAMRQAKAVGAETMLLVPGVVTEETSYSTAYRLAVEGIEKLLPHAEEIGVKIGLENVWNAFLLSPLEAAALIDRFASPWLGWYFDIGNVMRNGRPRDWIEALGHRIIRVDVKEYSLKRMDAEGPWKGFDVALGDGDIDWAGVNRDLAALGYSGWASVEVPAGDRQHLAEIKRRFDRIRLL